MLNPVELLRSKVKAAVSLRQYAASVGLSAGYVSQVLSGYREPGPKILEALGLKRETVKQVTYKKARR